MTLWWSRQSIRLRLAVWYAGTLLVMLVLYGAGVFAFVRHSLSADLERRLHEDFEVVETMLERTPEGRVRWVGPLHPHDAAGVGQQIWAEVWTTQGELLFRNELPEWLAGAIAAPRSQSESLNRISLPQGEQVRYLQGPFSVAGQPVVIRVLRSETPLGEALARLILIELMALPLAVVIAGLGGYALARRLLEPIADMAGRAKTITADRLHERLPVRNPDDELGRLAAVFNTTFARLERSFQRLKQFTSDASHELRTPLTSIRSVGEVALRGARDETAYRDAIGSMLEEVDRLARLADCLLTLSRADAGRVVLDREPLDLAAAAREVIDDLCVLAEEKRQTLTLEVEHPAEVMADHQVLRRALVNLVDNAVRYSPEGAAVRIVVGKTSGAGTLDVIDQGPGIPAVHRERVFERFYRVDRSRSRSDGGCGLGLAIARWAIEAHGGRIELESEEGEGSVFRVTLPLNNEAQTR